LAAVAPQRLPTLLSDLHSRDVTDAVAVGTIESSNPGRISVIRSRSSQQVQKRKVFRGRENDRGQMGAGILGQFVHIDRGPSDCPTFHVLPLNAVWPLVRQFV
jgi:hypothetical protein